MFIRVLEVGIWIEVTFDKLQTPKDMLSAIIVVLLEADVLVGRGSINLLLLVSFQA